MTRGGGSRPPARAGTARTFSGVFTALAIFLVGILAVHYYTSYREERTRRESSESLNVELARRAVSADLSAVVTDVRFLARHIEGLSYDAGSDEARRDYLREVFLTFAREKNLYDQIRFIDAGGRETVRVNLNAGQPRAVPPEALQDKSARYYVRHAMVLPPGDVYISPLDLNVEDGRIERPIKPVMRFATPVDDAAGVRRGLVVMNYLGERLINDFRRAASNIADHVQLLNEDGYWLISVDPELEWGFMFGNEVTFGGRFPAAWRRIREEVRGQFLAPDGLFTFSTVTLGDVSPGILGGAEWKVVSHLPTGDITTSPAAFARRHAALYASLLGLLALVAYLLASAQVHRRAAESLREYERRFRQTLEDANLAAVMVDPSGRVTFCNRYLLRLLRASREEVVGGDWVAQFVPPEQKQDVERVLERLDHPDEFPERFESEIQTRSGERRLIAWNNTLARDAFGRVQGVTGIGEDVTDQRRAQEQVRKLSRAVEQSPSIVIITDRAGRIEYANPKFTEVTGYALSEVQGKNPRLLKSGETTTDDYRTLWETITAGNEWRGEFHNRRKNGELYWEAASISALRDEQGRITHFLAVKEDITERKRLEREVEESNRELGRAQTLAQIGRMAAEIAHDLRNPLSSVKMSLQILNKRAADEDAAELSRIGVEQVRYMEDILTDMLEYARPSALKVEWLSADTLLRTALGAVSRRTSESGVDVAIRCEPGLPAFPGDARKLHRLLVNLMLNAIQACESRPAGERQMEITAGIGFAETGTVVRLEVCDNGDGIAPAVREHLFEPFFTTRAKGTGLGLSIVRQIAEQHGGTVVLEPGSVSGTCARLELPVAPASGAAGETTKSRGGETT
jgi:PAS domain S-box-containing protein